MIVLICHDLRALICDLFFVTPSSSPSWARPLSPSSQRRRLSDSPPSLVQPPRRYLPAAASAHYDCHNSTRRAQHDAAAVADNRRSGPTGRAATAIRRRRSAAAAPAGRLDGRAAHTRIPRSRGSSHSSAHVAGCWRAGQQLAAPLSAARAHSARLCGCRCAAAHCPQPRRRSVEFACRDGRRAKRCWKVRARSSEQ